MQLVHNIEKYKHISFDLWLTLIKSNPIFKEKRNLLFKDYFQIDRSIEEVSAAIRKFDLLSNSINEKVTRNFDTNEIYCLILDHLEVDTDSYDRSTLDGFYLASEELFLQHKPLLLDDHLPQFFSHLRERGKTANILSNTAFIKGSTLRKILSHYGLYDYFAFQIYSDEVGCSKPGMEIYAHVYAKIQQLGKIEKHEVLHVGDNKISDYNGALSFGFGAHLITHETTYESKLQPL